MSALTRSRPGNLITYTDRHGGLVSGRVIGFTGQNALVIPNARWQFAGNCWRGRSIMVVPFDCIKTTSV